MIVVTFVVVTGAFQAVLVMMEMIVIVIANGMIDNSRIS